MGVVLVLEPDGAQAELLLKVLRKRVRAEAILVTSTASAIEVISHSTPDLILLTALLAPRDEDRLMEHLRSLEDASHLQTLTIPQLALPGDDGGVLRNSVGRFRKKKASAPARAGCDPDVFAQEVSAHLATAREMRKNPVRRTVRRNPPPEPEIAPSPIVVEDFPAPDPAGTDFTSVLFEDPPEQVVKDPVAFNDSSSVFGNDFASDESVAAPADRIAFEPEPASVFFEEAPALHVIEPEVEPLIEPEPMPVIGAEFASEVVPEIVPEIVAEVMPPDENDTVGHLDRLARRFGFRSETPKPVQPEAPAAPPAPPSTAMVLLAAFGDVSAPAPPRTVEVGTDNTVWLKPDITEVIIEETVRLKPDTSAAERRAAQAAAEAEARLVAERRAAEMAAAEAEARLAAERRAAERAAAEAEAKLAVERRAAERAAAEAEAQLAVERRAAERAAAEAEAKLAAERRAAEKAAAEAEARLAAERRAAEKAEAEAEARRAAERRAAEAAAAETEARLAAERLAAQAAAEAEARLAAEQRAAQAAAAETEARLSAERLAAQVAADAEARLAAELERVRAEGEARRLSELARLEAEAEIEREKAIAEARTAASREAREALASELTRARSEAEGVFAADLARVRAEVEDKLSAQVQAAETRLAQAEEARAAAEAAAADALGAEVARVRGEAEARLQDELERIRTEADAARDAELSVAKHATRKIREAAAREAAEARANAEAAAQRTLEAEMARVRAQADRFLQAEIERVRADAQERQAAELQELRAQMAEIRDTAARTAAEQSADYYKIWQPAVEAAAAAEAAPAKPPTKKQPKKKEETGKNEIFSKEEREEEEVSTADDQDASVEIAPGLLAGRHLPWLKWAVPTAACMLFIANIGPSAKPAAAPAHVVQPVEKPFVEVKSTGALKVTSTPAGARLLVDGKSYGQTPVTVPNLEPGQHTIVLRTSSGSITRKVTIRAGQTAVAAEAIFSGWVALYSAIPMTVSLNGKPAEAGSDGRIMTPPGTYEVSLVNEQFNFHGSKTLTVKPGEVTAYTVNVPSAPVHVVAPEGADITVDGNAAGKAPLAELSLPLGTHEVTATLPGGSKRGVTIAVRFGGANEARID